MQKVHRTKGRGRRDFRIVIAQKKVVDKPEMCLFLPCYIVNLYYRESILVLSEFQCPSYV